jgi:hypothetical protein
MPKEAAVSTLNAAIDSTAVVGVVAIARDNAWFHTYLDSDCLIQEYNNGTNPRGVEFFDRHGRRLAPLLSSAGELLALEPTAEDPDPHKVQGRLRTVIARAEEYIRQHPTVPQMQLPQLDGDTLDEDLASLGLPPAHGGNKMTANRGGWLHMLLCHGGG